MENQLKELQEKVDSLPSDFPEPTPIVAPSGDGKGVDPNELAKIFCTKQAPDNVLKRLYDLE